MREPSNVSQEHLPFTREGLKALTDQLVQVAPGPESPEELDRAGMQRGLVIALGAAGAFWLAVAGILFRTLG